MMSHPLKSIIIAIKLKKSDFIWQRYDLKH